MGNGGFEIWSCGNWSMHVWWDCEVLDCVFYLNHAKVPNCSFAHDSIHPSCITMCVRCVFCVRRGEKE